MKSRKIKIITALVTFSIGISAFFVWDVINLLPNSIQTRIVGKSHSDKISLQISSEKTSVKIGEELSLKVLVTNNDTETVVLVNPGDGSEQGWRTPIVQWSVIEAGEKTQHPVEPIPDTRPRCVNMNRLKSEEIFSLSPGETRELDWTYLPPYRKNGTYKVAFLYANSPSIEWRGESAINYHNPVALWQAKHSTETNLISNEIIFTVSE